MEIQDFLNISNNKEFLKFPSTDKPKTFLNKKRTATKDPTNATDLDLYEYQDEDLDNIFANAKSFNNINSAKEPNIPTNQNHIEGKNNISSLNINKEIELKPILTKDEENEEIKNKVNTPLKIGNAQKNKNIDNYIRNENTSIKNYHSKSQEKVFRTKIKLKNSDDLNCFALDLLKENGEFQIKFSNSSNNAYILKIKEVEIEDDYYKQS